MAINTGNSSRIFITFDTETTGLSFIDPANLEASTAVTSRGSEVCQIGGIIADSSMKPIKLFCHYCDTVAAESSERAFSVHGITQRSIRQYLLGQYLPEVVSTHLPEFFYNDVIFIGYNSEFDMKMVQQCLSNSSFLHQWDWKPLRDNFVPKRGRYSIDICTLLMVNGHRRKLASFDKELASKREEFLRKYSSTLSVDTNCVELLQGTWEHAHNSFFDALDTFLLWSDKIWKKKLV